MIGAVETRRLRFLLRSGRGIDVPALNPADEVTFVPMEAVGEQGSLDTSRTRPLEAVQVGYTLFRDGDVIVAKITPCFENGKGALAQGLRNGFAFGTTELHVLSPSDELDARFLYYVTASSAFRLQGEGHMSGSAGQKRVPEDFINDYRIRVWPISHQRAIAAYLDRETARLDSLVESKERVLQLLQRKRAAVLSRAITRGVARGVELRQSGIEWIGEVPSHWDVMPLKRDLSFVTSGSRGWAENYADDGELFIRIGNLTRDSIRLDLSDIQRVAVPADAEGARTKLQAGDILFSITAFLGSVAVVPGELESAYVSQHVALARLRQRRLLPNWVGYAALSSVGQAWFETQSYGGTKVQLSLDDIRDMPLPVPPIGEQMKITQYIENEMAVFDRLAATTARSVALIRERRSALISAAVTGALQVH